jgi:hypothetical protein
VIETTLIFPAGMPDGLSYRERAEAAGRRVVGASSVADDPAQTLYGCWEALPYVNDPGFDAALAAVLKRHAVTEVHTPHFVVWKHLSDSLPRLAPGVRLLGELRPEDHERAYRTLRARVAAQAPGPFAELPADRPDLSPVERAGLVRLVGTIPGMCGEDKMHAVIEVMRRAPPGDIVEIGSWWGRSAALFVWLSQRYDLGKVLCVDPWAADAMTQGDALLDSTSHKLDTEEALRMFEINLVPLAGGRLNYIRARSTEGARRYKADPAAETEVFGQTRYAGRIAVLHIDGNHAYDEVARDEAAWTPLVASGGWIIFDDYEWAFGDGPRRVGDAFVAREASRIEAAFTAGPSLFVKLKGAGHG